MLGKLELGRNRKASLDLKPAGKDITRLGELRKTENHQAIAYFLSFEALNCPTWLSARAVDEKSSWANERRLSDTGASVSAVG